VRRVRNWLLDAGFLVEIRLGEMGVDEERVCWDGCDVGG